MKTHKIAELVFDFDIYPRGSVDSHHVGEIAAAIEAGASMPPMVIDQKSKRIADGFHRGRAYLRLFGPEFEVECIEKAYKNDKELFLDSMRYNASHGRALTQHDKVHCLLLAEKLRVSAKLVGEALNITTTRIGELKTGRVGRIGATPIALKQTIRHMAGQTMTPEQGQANRKLSGMNQLFYVNQLVTLIENDLIDASNAEMLVGMERLRALLDTFLRKAA